MLGCITLAATSAAHAGGGLLTDDFWLIGEFTQNRPCSADGSDPIELKVRISADQINSNAGVCKILHATPEGPVGRIIRMHVQCQLPAGPLVGDITFTQKTAGAVDFIDSGSNYAATLYRCGK